MALGADHSLAQTTDGRLYAFGRGDAGQLGPYPAHHPPFYGCPAVARNEYRMVRARGNTRGQKRGTGVWYDVFTPES